MAVRKYIIVKCRVGCEPEVAIINRSLEAVQESVGGYVTEHPIEELRDSRIMMLCDEEGGMKQRELNQHKPLGVRGDFIFIGYKGNEWASLTDEQILEIGEYLGEEVVDER
jgi:hypothetical protein